MILTSLFALARLDNLAVLAALGVLAYLDNLAALKRSNLQEALQNRAVSVRPMSTMHPVSPMRPMRATLKNPRTYFFLRFSSSRFLRSSDARMKSANVPPALSREDEANFASSLWKPAP